MVKYLHSKGAEINVQSHIRETALTQAASRGYTEIVKYLCENKAEVNIYDRFGKKGTSALMKATKGGHDKCVEILLKYGAEVTCSEDSKHNIFHMSAAFPNCLSLLKQTVKDHLEKTYCKVKLPSVYFMFNPENKNEENKNNELPGNSDKKKESTTEETTEIKNESKDGENIEESKDDNSKAGEEIDDKPEPCLFRKCMNLLTEKWKIRHEYDNSASFTITSERNVLILLSANQQAEFSDHILAIEVEIYLRKGESQSSLSLKFFPDILDVLTATWGNHAQFISIDISTCSHLLPQEMTENCFTHMDNVVHNKTSEERIYKNSTCPVHDLTFIGSNLKPWFYTRPKTPEPPIKEQFIQTDDVKFEQIEETAEEIEEHDMTGNNHFIWENLIQEIRHIVEGFKTELHQDELDQMLE